MTKSIDDRYARLAAALRANLNRRKTQARNAATSDNDRAQPGPASMFASDDPSRTDR